MPTVLDRVVGSSGAGASNSAAPVSDKKDQAEHAASPNDFNFGQNAVTITLALLGMYIAIYLLHGLERVAKAA